MIQQLEPRRLLSLSVSVNAGVLIVQGDQANNVITVDQNATSLTVALDQSTFSTPLRKVKAIQVFGMAGNDLITLTPNITLPATLYGGAGNDTLVGSNHPCTLSGDDGNDVLRPGHGGNVVSGGPGIDTADFSSRTEGLTITLDGKANDGSRAAPGVPAENDNVLPDIEIVIGGSGDDKIVGDNLANTLIGGPGNDSLYGMGGNDVLVGGTGNNYLSGGDGDDVLIATNLSSGDTLDGGAGNDAYAIDDVQGVRDKVLNCELELSVINS
ncbi:MAG: hypothetical protein ABSH20_00595 [Tepidisphaeraceae bacterium]